jgi:hypothetical protein
LVEPRTEQNDDVEEKDHSQPRHELIGILRSNIPRYHLFNGNVITPLLSRLQEMSENQTDFSDFREDLTLEDDDSTGFIKFAQILKSWRINNLPPLDPELEEFMFYLAMRNSEEGSNRIQIDELIECFDEDYLLRECKLDDPEGRFRPDDANSDQDDVDAYERLQ